MADPPVETASGLLIDTDGSVLLGRRAAWKRVAPGLWDAIGGHVEPGETLEEALVRELSEEIGVQATDFHWIASLPEPDPQRYGPALHHVFAVRAWTGQAANVCDEHDEIRWFSGKALRALTDTTEFDFPDLLARGLRARAGFSLRPYRAEDAPAMAEVFYHSVRIVGPRAYSPEQVACWAPARPDPELFATRAADGRSTLVAVDTAGEVVGYGDLEADGHLDHLYCRPDVVGQGVGSRLIDEITAMARAQGLSRIYVEASEIARPVFERRGFRVVRRRDFEVRGVMIHNYAMEKTELQTL